jgi:hypothetical protein
MATAQPTGFAEPLNPTGPAFRPGISTPPLRAAVEVQVRALSGLWHQLDFIVDSGAGVTSIPWATASCFGIPLGTQRVNTPLLTFQGPISVLCYRHTIEVEFPQLPGHRFIFDCHFPDVPSSVPPVLGIGGDVLRQLQIHFDGSPQLPNAPFGVVRIEVAPPGSTGPPPVAGAPQPPGPPNPVPQPDPAPSP